MKNNARDRFWLKAVKAANKKLRFLPDRKLTANLEFCGDDVAEAYRCGAEEAQGEIINRLAELQAKCLRDAEGKE
jgi:hypothetical protein